MRTCSLTKTIWDEDFLGNQVPLNYHFERHFPIWKVSFFCSLSNNVGKEQL
ncbi:hypothetical protein HMPREF9494_01682 [Enterococcus faecalis TX2137]|nr:hypothetical protein HMPREF9494_01682 [Enterococcus faecalis TX2137]